MVAQARSAPGAGDLSLRSTQGRWVLLTTVLGSGIAFLDGTVVNVALPRMGSELHAGMADLQWTVTAYTLTLSAFLLLGGALGDRYGRRLIFVIGLWSFAIASLLCGIAPSAPLLVAARAVQGMGGALLTPGSLAIIQATFRPSDRGAAIGAWSGFAALFGAAGPLLGGVIVMTLTWRLVFFINLPLALVAGLIALRHVPETMRSERRGRLDVQGPLLAAAGLTGVTFGLIQGTADRWAHPADVVALAVGVVLLVAFVVVEWRGRDPVMPLGLFRSPVFSGTNGATFLIYGALSGVSFLVVLQLQEVLRYSPLAAGVSLLPLTLTLLLLSSRAGRLAAAIGPRIPMTVGPLLAAAGMAMFARLVPGSSYATTVLPAAIVFGLGMTLTVPALTTTALGAVPTDRAGVASAVNNDVARAAGLIAIAIIPALAGIATGGSQVNVASLQAGFGTGMFICAGFCAAGGIISFLTVPGREKATCGARAMAECAMPPSIAVPIEEHQAA
ncbi:MAG TPA: MFS transporter [Candidatus Dormibacteraeota bacterium]|nr:MFS transporter [Candidatus Dormibacteraeota bacterium]